MLSAILASLLTLSSSERPDASTTAAAAAAAVGTMIHCERVWPDAADPPPRRSRACAVYFLAQGYGPGWTSADLELDPLVGGLGSWRLHAPQYEAMAAAVRASCDGACDRVATRAIELFERQAAAQLGIVDPWTLESFEPLLAEVLAGRPLDEAQLVVGDDVRWSPVTLWKLRSAVFARHGARFEHPDLERFFYGDRGPDAMPVDTLPLPPRPPERPIELEPVDRDNLGRLYDYEEATSTLAPEAPRRAP